ncbi:(2Fe-2S)-binding protein [Acuticoccus kandeliae]|uniref:(2Fe-2S)-binding protein n=1 Tax=Acuticoccus kandeliae TaxID=2073160 RepID=UPI000D3E5A8F|nr:(2Fe-2S)-binding protein [Acuticoccus kandeliae]
MIVCHCNVIKRNEIRDSVRRILAEDPSGRLEPQYIYRELQKRGRCCSCFPTVNAIVEELFAESMKDMDPVSLSAIGERISKDA